MTTILYSRWTLYVDPRDQIRNASHKFDKKLSKNIRYQAMQMTVILNRKLGCQ